MQNLLFILEFQSGFLLFHDKSYEILQYSLYVSVLICIFFWDLGQKNFLLGSKKSQMRQPKILKMCGNNF